MASKSDFLRLISIKCPHCNVYVNPTTDKQGQIICPSCKRSLEKEVLDYIEEERPDLSKFFQR